MVLVLCMVGCATTKVNMIVRRPAEVSMKHHKKIALGDITGRVRPHAIKLQHSLRTMLVSNSYFDSIVDRDHLQRLLKEHELTLHGIVEENAIEIGKLTGASAFVFCRIITDDVKDEIEKGKVYTDDKGKEHQKIVRNVTYSVSVSVYIIDVTTSSVLLSRILTAERSESTNADMKEPPRVDYEVLFDNCVNDVLSQLSRIIAPYNVTIAVKLEKDALLPDVERVLAYFRMHEFDKGLTLLKTMAEAEYQKPKIKAKALYNYGMVLLYSGFYQQAHSVLMDAFELVPTSKKYQKAVFEVKEEQNKYLKLKEQE